ncbi:MAG: hypothetical protein NT134_02960 [Chloroflexi bacterium]|nr:hypothetical protein [Chloroflexota bacterium]
MAKQGKFGARVFLMDTEVIYVRQTVKRGTAENAPYVIDKKAMGEREGQKFVDITDDKSIADAIRAALNGRL